MGEASGTGAAGLDRAQAEAAALAYLHGPDAQSGDELVVVPDSTVEKPYGWVLFVQSRRYLESGDFREQLVGIGPVVVLRDGAVHTLPSALPSEDALDAFEAEHGLQATPWERPADAKPMWPPVWVGAQEAGRFPVIALTPAGVVVARLRRAEVDALVAHGPSVLDGADATTIPASDIDRVRIGDDAGLSIERRGDVSAHVRFASAERRDEAFHGLHGLVAPRAPIVELRRPARRLVELAGLALLCLALGLGLPWMVEAGMADRTQWLVAAIFNTVGPNGFRALGVALAAGCLAGLVVLAVRNPPRTGYRVR